MNDAAAPSPVQPHPSRDSLLELVGLTAYIRLGLFGLIAKHTYDAPGLRAAQRMASIGVRIGQQQQALIELGRERGVDAVALMRPFGGVLGPFEERTAESTWWEGVLKAVVGHGVAGDLCRILARGLDADVRTTFERSLVPADRDEDLRVTEMVAATAGSDPVLASRLSLWGRRVVGESLTLSRSLLERPLLASLASVARAAGPTIPLASGNDETPIVAAESGESAPLGAAELDDVTWVLAELKAEHARRMERMGLTA